MPDDNDTDVDGGENEGAANVGTDQDRVDTAEKGDRGEFDVGGVDTSSSASYSNSEGLFDAIGRAVAGFLGIEKGISKANVASAVASLAGFSGVGTAIGVGGKALGAIGSANEAQHSDAISKGNIDAQGNAYGTGLMGETVSIGLGPGGGTGQGSTGSGMGDEKSGILNPNNIDGEPPKPDEGIKSMFSGKSPYDLYQESLLKHERFKISIPSIVDFPTATLPSNLSQISQIYQNDPNVIPVHMDDMASPLAAIIKSGQRSIQSGGRN